MGQPQGALRFFQVSTCSLACSSDLITHVDLGIFHEDGALLLPSGSLLPSGAHCLCQPLRPTATPLLTIFMILSFQDCPTNSLLRLGFTHLDALWIH